MHIAHSVYNDVGFNTIRQWLADHTSSQRNIEKFHQLTPQTQSEFIKQSFELTEEIINGTVRKDILPTPSISDCSFWLKELHIHGSQLSEEYFKSIRYILSLSIDVKSIIDSKNYPQWYPVSQQLIDLKAGIKKIESVFDDAFIMREDASDELLSIHRQLKKTQARIQSRMKEIFAEAQKEDWLQDDHIAMRNGRNVLPMKASQKRKIKGIVQSQSATGQTVFIEPIEIIELNIEHTNLQFKKAEEIQRILAELTSFFRPHAEEIEHSIHILERFDYHITIAKFSITINGVQPTFVNKGEIYIENGRNPLLELADKSVVPLNLTIDDNENILLLSGPNAGGKTVTLKTMGLFSIMAQCGIFIPAEKCTLPIFKQILSDIGDQQSIEDDLSTFSAHIQNLSAIIEKSDKNTLILLDELGTGTDPDAGAAISRAILESLLESNAMVFATTHLGALKSWAHETDGVKNGGMVFDPNGLKPTYELQLGYPGASYAIEISTRMGLDKTIINRATNLIGDNSVKLEEILRVLEEEQKKVSDLKTELSIREERLQEKETAVRYIENELKKKQKHATSDAATEAEALVIETRREMERLISDIRSSNADKESIRSAKNAVESSIKKLKPLQRKPVEKSPFKTLKNRDAKEGFRVYIPHLELAGVIIHPPNNKNKVTVESNGLKLTLNLKELTYEKKEAIRIKHTPISMNKVERPERMRIDLRGKRVDEAIAELQVFIDRALVSGMTQVSILHGKGTGALMDAVEEYLTDQSFVKAFNFAHEDHGGAGITEVIFK